MDTSRSAGSLGSGGSTGSMEEVKRDKTEMGGGEAGESVSHPIPIVGGKMKSRGVECGCECCNKVGWFYFFFFKFPTLYMEYGIFSFNFRTLLFRQSTNINFVPDLPSSRLLKRTQMGIRPTMARGIQVRPLETPTSRSRRYHLVHGERSSKRTTASGRHF